MNEVKVVCSKFRKQRIKRGQTKGISFSKRGGKGKETVGVGVLIVVSRITRGEQMDGMTSFSQSVNQSINTDAHPIENRQCAI